MVKDNVFYLSTDALKRLASEGKITLVDDEAVIRVHRGNMDGSLGALAAGHEVKIKDTDYSMTY